MMCTHSIFNFTGIFLLGRGNGFYPRCTGQGLSYIQSTTEDKFYLHQRSWWIFRGHQYPVSS